MEEFHRQWAPLLLVDEAEPFAVLAACVQEVPCPGPGYVVEYRVAWSADIGHAYDIESVRITADGRGASARLLSVEGSAHGSWVPLDVPRSGERLQAFVEPGKHGFGRGSDDFSLPADVLEWFCGEVAGVDGVHRDPLVTHAGLTSLPTLRSCSAALRDRSFRPRWSFNREVDVRLVPWLGRRAFDELVLASITSLAEEREPRPLRIQARDRLSQGGYWWVGPISTQGGLWTIADSPAAEIFRHARQSRASIVADLPPVDPGQLRGLRNEAWPHYMTSRLLLVCASEMVDAVFAAGLVPVPVLGPDGELPHAGSRPDLISWVRSRTCDQTAMFSGTALVVGPGDADLVLET